MFFKIYQNTLYAIQVVFIIYQSTLYASQVVFIIYQKTLYASQVVFIIHQNILYASQVVALMIYLNTLYLFQIQVERPLLPLELAHNIISLASALHYQLIALPLRLQSCSALTLRLTSVQYSETVL
jgi:hypothetical protein